MDENVHERFQIASKQLCDAQKAEHAALVSSRAQQESELEIEYRQKLARVDAKYAQAKLRVDAKYAGFIKKQ